MSIAERIIARVTRRKPDLVIGPSANPYMIRWWVIPRNRLFNIYLHCFKRSDDDRALHTHPWLFNASWVLRNKYREWIGYGAADFVDRNQGKIKFRWGASAHRVELINGDCWTIFVTGPRVREWGFLCRKDLSIGAISLPLVIRGIPGKDVVNDNHYDNNVTRKRIPNQMTRNALRNTRPRTLGQKFLSPKRNAVSHAPSRPSAL